MSNMAATNMTTSTDGTMSYLESIAHTEFDQVNALKLLVGSGLLFVIFHIATAIQNAVFGVKAPVVGYKHFWEPGWVVGMRFARASRPMILEGYSKFKGSMFKLRRNDNDILVISHKHVNDLRDMHENELSPMGAIIKNLVAPYTVGNMSLLTGSDLHRRVIQQKLTPSLGNFIPPVKDELDYALQKVMPQADDWSTVQIHEIFVQVIARVSARIFVGPDLCRNQEWLNVSIKFAKNVGMTRNMVRILPTFLRPILAPTMKSYWRIYSDLKAAQRMLVPVIDKRRSDALNDPDYKKPNDFLQWMIDDARGTEGHADNLAHRQLMVGMAAIHTTSMQGSHFIYDLCAHPEYAEALREEIVAMLLEDGGWKKSTLNKMRKLDSFLKECQRMNPPLFLSFQRVAKKPLTLSDGTHIPTGTHIAMASDAILHDSANLPGGGDPEVFNGFRYSKLREDAENTNRYQFATSDSTHLHFGHGKYACPGRFFASNEVKMIICHLLIGYEFKFPPGQGRPKNLSYEEAQYPDPRVSLLMKKRVLTETEAKVAAFVNL